MLPDVRFCNARFLIYKPLKSQFIMKRLMLSVAMAIALSACNQNENVSPADQTSASARGFAVDGFGKGAVITADKLPQAVLTYLTATYAGYTFVGARQAADSAGVVLYYEVGITQNGKLVRLNFDATGKLLERPKGGPGRPDAPKGTSITADKLPAATTTYLTATYAGYTFKRAEQVTTRDGVTLYAVAITQNSTDYFLLFNADGSFRAVLKKK